MQQLDAAVVSQEIQKLTPSLNNNVLFSVSLSHESDSEDTMCKSDSFGALESVFI